jgi:hypothetical protein
MNTTLLVFLAVLAVYVATCIHQWKRLNRPNPKEPPPR